MLAHRAQILISPSLTNKMDNREKCKAKLVVFGTWFWRWDFKLISPHIWTDSRNPLCCVSGLIALGNLEIEMSFIVIIPTHFVLSSPEPSPSKINFCGIILSRHSIVYKLCLVSVVNLRNVRYYLCCVTIMSLVLGQCQGQDTPMLWQAELIITHLVTSFSESHCNMFSQRCSGVILTAVGVLHSSIGLWSCDVMRVWVQTSHPDPGRPLTQYKYETGSLI